MTFILPSPRHVLPRFIILSSAWLWPALPTSLTPLGLASFTVLQAVSTHYNDQPDKASRPFDKGRDGEDITVSNSEVHRWVREIAGTRTHGSTGRAPLDGVRPRSAEDLGAADRRDELLRMLDLVQQMLPEDIERRVHLCAVTDQCHVVSLLTVRRPA